MAAKTLVQSPYQIPLSHPAQPPRRSPANHGFTCLCALAKCALQGGANATLSAAYGKSLTPAQRSTPYSFPHSVQNGRRYSPCTLIPASGDLAGADPQDHRQIRLGIFSGDTKPWKPMSENTVDAALRSMGHDTTADICSHGIRSMACSADKVLVVVGDGHRAPDEP